MSNRKDVRPPKSTIIFIHIPKTGGRTLEQVLKRQYSPDTTFNIYGYDSSIPEAVQKLKHLSVAEKRNLLLIKGHYQFGLHRLLPQACTYITFLRDPVDRVVSHYYYVKRAKSHPLHAQSQAMTLEDYVKSGISLELNNGQARLLSGFENRYEFGECEMALLAESKRNIRDHFRVIGIVESYEESLALMKITFSWRRVNYIVRNVSEERPQKEKISEHTLEVIRSHNDIDLELYKHAKLQLKRQIAQEGSAFIYELAKLKAQNRLYQLKCRGVKVIKDVLAKSN